MAHVPTVQEWLTAKNVLITGGTGFIGQVLVEKLMRSCPNIGTIYLFIRPKWGKTAEERHLEITKGEIFSYSGVSYDFSKLVLVSADMSVAGLALPEDVIKTLHDNVHIVFHAAASIKFNDTLVDAIKTNTRLTRDMVELAKGMTNLEVFAHVSTGYVNVDHTVIEEKVYPAKMDWRKAIELAEWADPSQVDAVTAAALGELPNTYCFSKHMAEHVVWDHRHELPILIFRPVVVLNLKNEPEPGWSTNFSGPEVILLAIGKGIIRVLGIDKDTPCNVCAGDITINGLIAAAWKLACHSKVTGEPADQVVGSAYTQRSTANGVALGREMIKQFPMPDILWTDYFIPVKGDRMFLILHLLLNVLPAILFETLARATGRKAPLLKALRKYYVSSSILFNYIQKIQFFMLFDNWEKVKLALSEEDRNKFNMNQMDPGESQVEIVVRSIKRMLKMIGEREISKEEGFRQQRRMVLIDQIFRFTLLGFVIYFFPYQTVLSFIVRHTSDIPSIFTID